MLFLISLIGFAAGFSIPIVYILGYAVLSFFIAYNVIKYLFEKFVFRKIKLIYKFISNSKNSLSQSGDTDIRETTIDDVNTIVKKWAAEREDEITSLKTLESYRKNFVGDISHELKTPLFSIQGYLHTLLDGGLYDENINRKYLERAAKNADRLKLIVDDLEMINSLESETTLLEVEKFSLKALASEVMSDLELLTDQKNIDLYFKPGADSDYNVEADKDKIRQVFVNLISNSIKYGKESGRTKVSFYDMDKLILVEISDDGIGIKEEHMKHVFDRFYRADKSRSREVGGSGLGLSIVKHIIEAHNQKITVRSTYEAGSTFGFTLKRAK